MVLIAIFCALPQFAQCQSQATAPKAFDERQLAGSVSGTVVDSMGAVVAGAQVQLTSKANFTVQQGFTDGTGQFFFSGVVPGPFDLAITASTFAPQVFSATLAPGQAFAVPQIYLKVATATTDVQVKETLAEVAEDEVKVEEQQRVLGVVPNFYVSYIPNAAPLPAKQKFQLAWKTLIDPVSFGITGAIAGIEQASDQFNGYGQGAAGYGRRYGAAYGDFVIGTTLSSAVFPVLFKQDPRYFYKGTGSKKSRVLYAIANSVICKGDNGRWQLNYSGILGGLAAGGISNLYYPAQDRDGLGLTFENAGIGIASGAAANIIQEFVIRKLTPHIAKSSGGGLGDAAKTSP